MTKKTNLALLVLAVGVSFSFSAAQTSTPVPSQPAPTPPAASEPAGPGVVDPGHPRVNEVDQRLEDQRRRIQEGLRNGTLSKEEARQMWHHDQEIAAKERKDMAANGGHLTPQEQNNLNNALNKNSREIYNEKHDGKQAGPGVVDPGHPRVNEVDQRLQNQKERIEQGVKNGTMTKQEAQQAWHNDKRIANHERKDMAANGGHLTQGEQRHLNKALNKNSNKIYKDKRGK
jgi:hypothetical protein